MSEEWYYVDNDEQQAGPVNSNEMKTLFESGTVSVETYIWGEDLEDWVTIDQVPAFKSLFEKTKSKPEPEPEPEPVSEPAPAVVPAIDEKMAAPVGIMNMLAGAPPTGGLDPLAALKKKRKEKRQAKIMEDAGRGGDEVKTKSVTPKKVQRRTVDTAEAAKWRTLKTPEGVEYYHNKETNATQWGKPECLKTADELDKAGEWYWIPDADDAFVPARLISKTAKGSWMVETEDGASRSIGKKHLPLDALEWSQLRSPVADLVLLDVMNRPLILHNLRERFVDNKIYTNVGSILIALNPYKRLPLYTPSIIEDYQRNRSRQPPHVYGVADDAFQGMIKSGAGQSIVISGESGAGKTVCTKQCMQYLAEVAGSSESNIEQKILSANPILEAFGNAKTVRNNNSSRFGKYVEIFFDKQNRISGASTTNYLLEKSRVIIRSEEERNYHVFFQLCRGASPELLASLHMSANPKDYSYLKDGAQDVADMDDKVEFVELTKAMEKLQFTKEEYNNVFKIVAGVLHLGNIKFESTGDRKCSVVAGEALGLSSKLLGLDAKKLQKAVTSRVFKSRGAEDIDIPLGKKEAESVRDALGKFAYEKLFDWLVNKVNKITAVKAQDSKQTSIGVLDIFGFEIFKTNSFEQLCINFANEKLQQFFNFWTFKREESVYDSEKINYTKVKFIDNQGVLDLIEKKRVGILPMIDEEIRMPKGNDTTFMKKLELKHAKTREFKRVLRRPENFIVVHYAGNVEYCSESFLVKSKDRMTEDLYSLITQTSFDFLSHLFPEHLTNSKNNTLGSKFKKQLNDLMRTLHTTEPHYIRCIKPNPRKAPLEFVGQMVLMQLQYSGVFEAVEIRKKGFPFRYSHEDFWKHYRCILPAEKWPADRKACCQILVDEFKKTDAIKMGITRVLYRANDHKDMMLRRNLAIERIVILIQSRYRVYAAIKLKRSLLKVRPQLRDALKTRDLATIDAALVKCDGLGFPILEISKLKRLKYVIEEEKRVQEKLKVLLTKDPEDVFDELEAMIISAEDIKMMNDMVAQGKARIEEIKVRRKTRAWMIEGAAEHDREKLEWAVESFETLDMGKPEDKKLFKEAQTEIKRIHREEKIVVELQDSLKTGGYLQAEDVVDFTKVEAAVKKAEAFTMLTTGGITAFKCSSYFLSLRVSMSTAVGTKDKKAWNEVEQVLQSNSDYNEEKEVTMAISELSKQRSESDVDEKLQMAVKAYDQDALAYQLQQAKQFNMFGNPLYPIVEKAQTMLDHIVECRAKLQEALKRVEQELLELAVADAESFGYETEEVSDARVLRDTVGQLNLEAAQARELMEEPYMQDVTKRAETVSLETDDIKHLASMLLLSEEKLAQEQLRAANRIKDVGRKNLITIKLKSLVIRRAPEMFALKCFNRLRSPAGWASLKLLTLNREKLADKMMRHTKSPMHAALTEMTKPLEKVARTVFKSVLGFMGDRRYDYPELLAKEILVKCLEPENRQLRDEVYMQIIKQLTSNQNQESFYKGWQLMRICLECFPPQESENYVTQWLEKNGKPANLYIDIMHRTIFTGTRRTALSDQEIKQVMDGKCLGDNESFRTPDPFTKPTYTCPDWKSLAGSATSPPRLPRESEMSAATEYEDEPQAPGVPEMPDELQAHPEMPDEPQAPEVPEDDEEEEEKQNFAPPPPMPPRNPESDDWGTAEHEGQTYYFNKVTGETTWDKPACLQ